MLCDVKTIIYLSKSHKNDIIKAVKKIKPKKGKLPAFVKIPTTSLPALSAGRLPGFFTKWDKNISLKISVGIIFFFLSQIILSYISYPIIVNIAQSGQDPQAALAIFNLIQLVLIAVSGGVIGYLISTRGIYFGAIGGLIATALLLALSVAFSGPEIPLDQKIIGPILNGAFITVLMAIGGKAGQFFYIKRHPMAKS